VHGGDNPHAFVVDLTKDLWYCFTRRQGGGDVVELVRRMHRVGYRQCAHYLATLTHGELLYQSSRIVLMLNGDDAGRSASRKIANALSDTDLSHRLHPFFSRYPSPSKRDYRFRRSR
jgi:hypothetical protein